MSLASIGQVTAITHAMLGPRSDKCDKRLIRKCGVWIVGYSQGLIFEIIRTSDLGKK